MPVSVRKRGLPVLRAAAWVIVIVLAAVVLLGEFLAPYDPSSQTRSLPSSPRTPVHFSNEQGTSWPGIRRMEMVNAIEGTYREVGPEYYPIEFLAAGEPYHIFGLVPAQRHLFGVGGTSDEKPRIHLLGTDALGRDRFSRLVIATKFSLIVTPIGAALAFVIGVLIGSVSGYAGRFADTLIAGVTDTMLALPTLILVLAARAAFPLDLPPIRAATLLIVIFALTGWAEIARLARGLVRSIKEREYILAARSIGLSEPRILFRHILPNAAGPLAAQGILMLPYFLLSEVALSFLGVGLQEPQPSLGNMLTAAADISQLQRYPFLLLSPALVIFAFVFAIQVLGRKRRD